MRKLVLATALVSTVTLGACSDSNSTPPAVPVAPDQSTPSSEPDTSADNTESSARYRLTFNADWSSDTHPVNFPSNPHFSPLIGALHNAQVIFWEPGQLASDGIEVMAESGGTGTFQTEINDAIASGYASTLINEGGIAESPNMTSFEFEIDVDNPLITLTSMVAPSPDWFVGVHNLSLLVDGAFVDDLTVQLSVYDSGTDSGLRYVSADDDTQPPAPISLLTSDPADSPFINGQPVAGTFVFEKL